MGKIGIGIILFFMSMTVGASPLQNSTVSYTDPLGHEWQRWIFLETDSINADAGTQLIVVENPKENADDRAVSQRVVFDGIFSPSQADELKKTWSHYTALLDLQTRPLSDYAPLSKNFTNQPLWTASKIQWTLADEADYSAWFTANVTTTFLAGSGIAVDCAKFAVAVRWIYAHDHNMPVANTLMGSKKLIGQWSGTDAWDKLPTDPSWKKDIRFKTALRYVIANIFTHSIYNDLYPAALNAQFVTPGSVDLVLYSSTTGHTQLINALGISNEACEGKDCLTVLYGDEPAGELAYLSQAWIANGGISYGGFMRWKWPTLTNGSWSLTPASKMPGYSLEQFGHPELSDTIFEQLVYDSLGIKITDTDRAIVAGSELSSLLGARLGVTALGYFYCSVQKCSPTSSLYDSYSTPSRDKRLLAQQKKFMDLAAKVPAGDEEFQNFITTNQQTSIIMGFNVSWYDYMVNTNGILDKINPDPQQSFFVRWGLNDSDPDGRFQALAAIWETAWLSRDALVTQAEDLCFPNGAKTSTCDPHSSQVQLLNTSWLDGSLRTVRADFKTLATQIKPATLNDVTSVTQSWMESSVECSPGNACTTYDFLLSDRKMVETMSSAPEDLFLKRYGL